MNKTACLTLTTIVALLAATLNAQKPPKGFEKVDQEIVISTMQAQMKYDVRSFSVKPNAKVKLVFKNPDTLPHNLIICTPGKKKGGDKGQEVIDAVLKLGDKGVEQNWEPKGHPRILVSSGMVQPKKETTMYFKVPKKEGDYPYICTFPGHFQLMNGMMGVSRLANPITNLTYKLYHGGWNKMPDFSKIEPKKTGVLANGLFDISPRDVNDNFGFVFNGDIECPKDGKYTFSTSSDDGSLLLTDGKLVVNNDGIHGVKGGSGSVTLKKGKRAIEVRFFEKSGGEALSVGWSGPGIKNQALSRTAPSGGGGGAVGLLIEPPEGEASIYRNFINGAGPRAIGVGYHERVNLAFDANNFRLAMIWQGDFIDGARHWKGRGQGYQPPAGDAVIKFPEGVAFAILDSPEGTWPKAEYRTKDFRFRGYLLDKYQRPTFKYERGEIVIEDTPVPISAGSDDAAGQIKRVIKLKAKNAPANLYFRIAQGDFEEEGGSFQSSELVVTVKGGKATSKGGELRVPVTFKNGSAQLEITYGWVN
ncbi:MAG: PA14 domain-containing protein [Opitutales bacterium]